MKREEKIEELLSSKRFDELTLPERELVMQELGSEEHYEAMRKIGVTLVKKTTGLSPNPKILKSLQQHMLEQNQTRSQLTGLLTFRIPAYASVLLILLFSTITWLISKNAGTSETPPITIVHTDTVYLVSRPDTVFQDRIIYRYARLKSSFPPNLNRTVQAQSLQKQPEA